MNDFVVILLVVGLIAGFAARALAPGPQPMGVGATMLLGVVGSFAGGFGGYLLDPGRTDQGLRPVGLLGAVVGSVLALLVYRRSDRAGHLSDVEHDG